MLVPLTEFHIQYFIFKNGNWSKTGYKFISNCGLMALTVKQLGRRIGNSWARTVAEAVSVCLFQVVFLKGRGVLVGGESIEEAFHLLRRVMNAVDTQVCTSVATSVKAVWKVDLVMACSDRIVKLKKCVY